jgi:MFS family permease
VGVVALVTVITVLTNGPVFLPGAASELISRDIGLGPSHIGLIITLYWASSILGAFVSRHAKDGGSVEHRIGLALLATATSLIIGGFWPEVGLWIGGAAGGFIYGYTQPHTNYLLIRRCVPHIRGLAFGVKQAAIPTATLLFSVAVPIVAEPPGWRLLLIAVGMICLAVAVTLLDPAAFTGERAGDDAEGSGRSNLGAGNTGSAENTANASNTGSAENTANASNTGNTANTARHRNGPQVQAAPPPSLRLPLNRHLLGLAIAGGCGAAVGNSLGGFLISSLTQSGGSLLVASLIASAGSITAIVVRVVFGVVVDRSTRTPGQLLSLLFVIGAVGTALLAVPNTASRALGGLLAYGGGWGWAGLLHYEAGAAYPGKATPATAVTQMGVSLGGAVGPLSFGILMEGYDPEIAWLVMTGVGLVAYFAVILARRAAPALTATSTAMPSTATSATAIPASATAPPPGVASPAHEAAAREAAVPGISVPGPPGWETVTAPHPTVQPTVQPTVGAAVHPPVRLSVWSIADSPFPAPGLLYAALETATLSQVTMWSVADLPPAASSASHSSDDSETTAVPHRPALPYNRADR